MFQKLLLLQNFITIYSKTNQIAHFKIKFGEACFHHLPPPPLTPEKAHASPCATCHFKTYNSPHCRRNWAPQLPILYDSQSVIKLI